MYQLKPSILYCCGDSTSHIHCNKTKSHCTNLGPLTILKKAAIIPTQTYYTKTAIVPTDALCTAYQSVIVPLTSPTIKCVFRRKATSTNYIVRRSNTPVSTLSTYRSSEHLFTSKEIFLLFYLLSPWYGLKSVRRAEGAPDLYAVVTPR